MKYHRHHNGLPALVEDVLETYFGRWFTVEQLADMVVDRRPHVQRLSVYRAVSRVLADPCVPIDSKLIDGRRYLRCSARSYLVA